MKKIAAKQPSEKIIGTKNLPATNAGDAQAVKSPVKTGRTVSKKTAKPAESGKIAPPPAAPVEPLPAAKSKPVKAAPAAKTAPVIAAEPVAKTIAAAKTAPVAEIAPVAKTAPNTKAAPVTKAAPAAKSAPVAQAAPAPEVTVSAPQAATAIAPKPATPKAVIAKADKTDISKTTAPKTVAPKAPIPKSTAPKAIISKVVVPRTVVPKAIVPATIPATIISPAVVPKPAATMVAPIVAPPVATIVAEVPKAKPAATKRTAVKTVPPAPAAPVVTPVATPVVAAPAPLPPVEAKKTDLPVAVKKTSPAAKSAAKTVLKSAPKSTPKPAAKKTAATAPRRQAPVISRPLTIPPIPSILLEGDAAPAVTAAGPGEKFSLGATPPAQSFSGGELPDSYGTKKLFLTARDPHWLYAHWDLTRDQQNDLNGLSTDGHLVLRIYAGKLEGHPACEIHVHPESRHWFAHVERAGSSYAAELGYYSSLGKWIRVAVSSGTVTPPDAAAAVEPEAEAEFATIPFEFPFPKLMQIVEEAVRDNIPLSRAIEELRRHGHPDLPRFSSTGFSSVAPSPSAAAGEARVWTPEQERALAKIIKIDETRRVWMGSLEITELIRRRLTHDASSPVAGFTSPAGYVPGGVSSASVPAGPAGLPGAGPGSSPSPGPEKNRGFWFNVNAELIIYGATEPTARVTLGGHEIKLRADGTFSFRFALPDGKYDLPAVAVSADGTDGRAAELKFSRETEYLGEVGVTPPDPALKPPLPDSI